MDLFLQGSIDAHWFRCPQCRLWRWGKQKLIDGTAHFIHTGVAIGKMHREPAHQDLFKLWAYRSTVGGKGL